ncbi:unnamed protein product [Dibothriocephalus latus]|uniref:Uncharacterized protein n=1 Tax=Dibothriocephalus latus TaxID=60516 RepID=A0A3P7PAC2_DIBLA|nr:unnamed protein product [Dibothriocephalus latus]
MFAYDSGPIMGDTNEDFDDKLKREPFSSESILNTSKGTPTSTPESNPRIEGVTLVEAVPTNSTVQNAVCSSGNSLQLKLSGYEEEDFSTWLRRVQFQVRVVRSQDRSMAILQGLTKSQLDKALDAGLDEDTPVEELRRQLGRVLKPNISKEAALKQMFPRSLHLFVKNLNTIELRRFLLLQPPQNLQEAGSPVEHYSEVTQVAKPTAQPVQPTALQNTIRGPQGNNWRWFSYNPPNLAAAFQRPQYPGQGGYNRLPNLQVCACNNKQTASFCEQTTSEPFCTEIYVNAKLVEALIDTETMFQLRRQLKKTNEQAIEANTMSFFPFRTALDERKPRKPMFEQKSPPILHPTALGRCSLAC